MAKRFFISDLHLGHSNIIKYQQRPFASLDEMHEILINNWNAVVSPDDEVYILGDFAFRATDIMLLGLRLQGKLKLVPGNHDLCFNIANKSEEKQEYIRSIYRAAEIEILDEQVKIALRSTDRTWSQDVLLCHFPYAGFEEDEYGNKFSDKRPVAKSTWLLHGHVHGAWKTKSTAYQGCINLSVEVWDYKPVAEEELFGMLEELLI